VSYSYRSRIETQIVISITSVVVECVVISSYRSRVVVESQLWYWLKTRHFSSYSSPRTRSRPRFSVSIWSWDKDHGLKPRHWFIEATFSYRPLVWVSVHTTMKFTRLSLVSRHALSRHEISHTRVTVPPFIGFTGTIKHVTLANLATRFLWIVLQSIGILLPNLPEWRAWSRNRADVHEIRRYRRWFLKPITVLQVTPHAGGFDAFVRLGSAC